MTESLDNLVAQHLRHIRGRVDQIADDMTTVKLRLSTIEEGLAIMKRGTALDEQTLAQPQASIDKLAERLARIEARLELL
ncbi:hypothetical protein ABZN20_02790 [Methylococcus sp. ANG]|jgi:predicted transcriptional regulator|uniref:hypothetical protein n=1 Tax=unclassified Methylococcus TaxID=2618889 RepID=UPI001C528D27|nr:hypothetical protein [Methylococcus sp. Mc7]QXP83589.1 hypothetical protein KW115_15710 [Methylococcus sp. Mc7]